MTSLDWLIICNKPKIDPERFKSMKQSRMCCICDGAYNSMHQYSDNIDVVIGDMDSIEEKWIQQLKRQSRIQFIQVEDQNTTDCEKAIRYCQSQQATSITILGGFGGRIDHSLVNLRLIKSYQQKTCPITMINGHYQTQIVSGEVVVEGIPRQHVSLIGFPSAIISTQGLQYDSQSLQISIDEGRDSACNALHEARATIHVDGCAVLTTDIDCKVGYI